MCQKKAKFTMLLTNLGSYMHDVSDSDITVECKNYLISSYLRNTTVKHDNLKMCLNDRYTDIPVVIPIGHS